MFIVTLKREITRNNRNFFVFLSTFWCFLTLKKYNRIGDDWKDPVGLIRCIGGVVLTVCERSTLSGFSELFLVQIQSATIGKADSVVIRYIVFDWNFLAISVNINNIVEGNEANQFTITKQDVGRANFQQWKFNFHGNLYSFLECWNDRSR